MSYALLSDDTLTGLEDQKVSRDARLLHIEATVYCATVLTDGEVRVRLPRITDADTPEALAQELVDAGMWEATADGYRLTDYLLHNRPRTEVELSKAASRERKERSRLHKLGNHSMCLRGRYCPDGQVTRDKTSDGTQDKTSDETPSNPTLSSPRSGRGRGNAEIESEDSTLALPKELLHDYLDAGGTCGICGYPKPNRRHNA